MDFIELDNGILTLRISEDASLLRITGEHGSREFADYIRADYGGGWVPLNLLEFGESRVSKEDAAVRIDIENIVWYARFPGHGYLKPDPAPRIGFSFRSKCALTSLTASTVRLRIPVSAISR